MNQKETARTPASVPADRHELTREQKIEILMQRFDALDDEMQAAFYVIVEAVANNQDGGTPCD